MIAAVLAAAATAIAATSAVLWGSRRWRVVDVPNERSSHVRPTPTLGGLGIVAGIGVGVALTPGLPAAVSRPVWGGLAVLLLAAYDDVVRPMGVAGKLLVQVLAVAVWLLWADPVTWVTLPGGSWALGAWGPALGAAWLLWSMNIFNFMDGIDGLTATQTVAVGGALACGLALAGSPVAALPAIVVAAVVGFLPFNLPPARIFMGDVGSVTLGYLVGVITLTAEPAGLALGWAALPLAYYAVDTTHTLARRALRGENVLRAHREHLYQRLVQSGWRHGAVDTAALAVTGPLAVAACLGGRGLTGWALVCALPAVVLLLAGIVWKERRHGG